MFDYTRAAVDKTISDCKAFAHIYSIAVQILYIVYLIYAIFAPAGIVWVNIALLSVSLCYFVFYLVTHGKNGKAKKELKVTAKHAYKIFKLSMRAFALCVMVYGIYIATTHITTVSVILAALAVVGWTLQVIFELAIYFIESHARLIMAGVEADKENLTRPIKAVSDFVKKLSGKEEEPKSEPKPSKFRRLLDSRVSFAKEKKKKEEKRDETVVK